MELFDEGVKEILLSLFSLGASVYEADYVAKQLNKRPEPIEQKVQAITQAKKSIPNFDSTVKRVLLKLNKQDQQPVAKMSDDDILKRAAAYIIPNEIYGGDLNNKQNDKFKRPYLDDKQIWTIGIGHKLVSGDKHKLSNSDIMRLFASDLRHHLKLVRTKFNTQWQTFTPELKVTLIDISFRGDLESPGKQDFDFIKSIKSRKFKQGAQQYLNHTEYKERLSTSKTDGVVKRMKKNAKNIQIQS